MQFDILGVRFVATIDDPGAKQFVAAFTDSYTREGREHVPAPSRRMEVVLRRDAPHVVDGGIDVVVHRSPSQAEWDFSGRLVKTEDGVLASWPPRDTTVELSEDRAVVTVGPAASSALAGESLFHVCRSLALYRREPTMGPLIHAAAVAGPAGAVAFCGLPGAGKTTLMLHAVMDLGYAPVANDRALLCGDPPALVGFPGYLSCCEGTLLTDPRLQRSAEAFEVPGNPLRTLVRDEPLKPDFSKAHKRLYPMKWLVDLTGTPYRPGAHLAALVLPRVAPHENPVLRQLDLRRSEHRSFVSEVVRSNVFASPDPSWGSWHGLTWPGSATMADDVLETLQSHEIPVFELRTTPQGCPGLEDLLSATAGTPLRSERPA